MSYFPLDRDLLTSSLWVQGTPEQVKVFTYLLLAADPRTGIVEDADPAVALRCALPLDVTVAALDWLASPDQYSRTKTDEGRRIKRLPEGGFLILNYRTHQDKDHSTPRVRRFRERQAAAKASETVGNGVSPFPKRSGTTNKNKNKNKNKNTTTTNSERSALGDDGSTAMAVVSPGEIVTCWPATWSREAAADWRARFGGVAPGGQIGRHLKKLEPEHPSWAAVRAAWRRYLAEAEAEYVSAERFAATYGHWTGTERPRQQRGALPKAAARQRAFEAMIRGGHRAELPAGLDTAIAQAEPLKLTGIPEPTPPGAPEAFRGEPGEADG